MNKKTNLYDKVTLALNPAWMPSHFLTKRRCFELLIRDKVDCLDSTFNKISTTDEWFSLDSNRYFKNPPIISSPKEVYILPSIVILNDNFIKGNTIAKSNVTLDEMCRIFNFTCQICKGKFRKNKLSVEHVYPRALGGSDDDFNKTLTCIRCNNQKNDAEKWFDKNGQELKGITLAEYTKMKFQVSEHRPEWEHFFIRKKTS